MVWRTVHAEGGPPGKLAAWLDPPGRQAGQHTSVPAHSNDRRLVAFLEQLPKLRGQSATISLPLPVALALQACWRGGRASTGACSSASLWVSGGAHGRSIHACIHARQHACTMGPFALHAADPAPLPPCAAHTRLGDDAGRGGSHCRGIHRPRCAGSAVCNRMRCCLMALGCRLVWTSLAARCQACTCLRAGGTGHGTNHNVGCRALGCPARDPILP